ncbi:MAG: hypothetical protein OXF72_08290 [Gammaproteobacteria bacterium]|nr:hypothetical protein [Gammaproteobacteria bacterium]
MTAQLENPFEYEAASNLSDDMVAEYFIDDFNYSRFIQSRRNVFIVGERGTGKTMALLFNSSRIQRLIAQKNDHCPVLKYIGVYVPCNTPLTYKPEFELLDPFLSSVLSEHLFALTIAHATVTTLADIPNILTGLDIPKIRLEISTILAAELSEQVGLFDAIRMFLESQIRDTQRTAVSRNLDAYHQETFSFASLVMPILTLCRRSISLLSDSHFLFLIDDAHALNERQVKALNSWIAFRDRSLFSFKVATTKVAPANRRTSSGGSVLEGHDYITIDLESPLHNSNSGYYKLARKVIEQRLAKVDITVTPEEFFPVNPEMLKDLERAKVETEKAAIAKYGESATKSVRDYVYKYHRSQYFKSRSRRANRPPYSGFETLVYISTGVIRNLLEPCYYMFDKAMSAKSGDSADKIRYIEPSIQREIILARSDGAWERLGEHLANNIEGCSLQDGERAYRLFNALAAHFRARLLGEGSEPGALSFTISNQAGHAWQDLQRILNILRSAQMLYVRIGTAKDRGSRELYYVPNRILWPSRGLDPHGQHARVSLTSDALWQAAETGQLARSTTKKAVAGSNVVQDDLWSGDDGT